jgi:hypothetical protein
MNWPTADGDYDDPAGAVDWALAGLCAALTVGFVVGWLVARR